MENSLALADEAAGNTIPGIAAHFVEPPRVEWAGGRPFAVSQLSAEYALALENLAHEKQSQITKLPVSPGWEKDFGANPTTARYSNYSAFLISPISLPLYFAIRETYRALLRALDLPPQPRLIQCWYNIHRAGESLARHGHDYPYIGTFSCHSEGSVTRYGSELKTSDSDVILTHRDGQVMVTTGPGNYHETSVWQDKTRPRVTYAFDILAPEDWNPNQIFVPFDI